MWIFSHKQDCTLFPRSLRSVDDRTAYFFLDYVSEFVARPHYAPKHLFGYYWTLGLPVAQSGPIFSVGKIVNTSKLNDWMQVIGIFAVVASLIFVGLEMRQAQEISMSQAYQSRTAAAAEWNSAFAANPAALSAFRKASERNEDEITTQEYDALRRTMSGLYYLYDNAHYQHQAGFVSSDFWEMTRESIKNIMQIPVVRGLIVEVSERGGRPEFRDLIQEIDKQLETQAGE